MNKAEVIKGLNMVISGFEMLRDAYAGDTEETDEKKVSAPATKKAVGGKKVSSKPAKEESSSGDEQTYTLEELSGMKYNEFKKLASSLGVDCKGTRDEIMKRVIDTGVVEDVEETDDEKPKKAANSKSVKSASAGKSGVKKADADSGDEFDKKAEEVAESLPVEEIISALKEVGVKATKMNYKKKLAEALRNGDIDLDEEEEETENGDEEISAEDYFEEYDLSKANDPDNMSEERAAACVAKQEEIINDISEEEITTDDIIDFLQNNGTQEELDLLGEDYEDSDLIKLYIEVSKHFIDEEGEEHEPGDAYMIGEDAYCCGQPLAYDKKSKKFLCSHCGADYDAE